VQGSANAVLFYNPVRKTISSRLSYAAVYQSQGKLLQIFLPAATKVIRRGRIGASHLHDPPRGSFQFDSNTIAGDQFSITSTVTLVAGIDFSISGNAQATAVSLADAINNIPGLDATVGVNSVSVFNGSLSNTLTMTFIGTGSIVASGPEGDPLSLEPDQEGPYIYDLSQPFTVSNVGTILNQNLDGSMSRVITVEDSSLFPDEQGNIMLGYGTQKQEGPIPYISRPSSTTLLISPAYIVKKLHLDGTDVSLVAQKAPVNISRDGLDYPFYITDVVSGRIYAQDLINSVAATGINIVFTVLYPGDIGLAKWGTQYSEISYIWGP